MAREIDLTQKLSDEDRKYLEDRDKWRVIQDNVAKFGGKPAVLPGEAPQTGPESAVVQLGPTAVSPEEQAKYDQANSDGQDEEPLDYEKMTVKELQAELDSRKADANEEGSDATDEEKANLDYGAKESRAQLIARLDKDDELVAAKE